MTHFFTSNLTPITCWTMSMRMKGLAQTAVLIVLVGCSTGAHKSDRVSNASPAEYWHGPPSLSVAESRLYIGMSGDDLARLIGIHAPGWVSPLPWTHYDLPGGALSVKADANGCIASWSATPQKSQ
jgi:hypothetical protein